MVPTIVEHEGAARIRAAVGRRLNHIDEEALMRARQIQAVEYVARTGMAAVYGLSALESMLVSQVPLAGPRLREVSDVATKAMSAVIADLLR